MAVGLVVIGFPGSGKSTVGETIARRNGWMWKDVDLLVENRSGKSISEIIRVEGEKRFRLLESKLLAEALSSEHIDVLTVGGGALLNEVNVEAIIVSGALLVSLSASAEEISRRVEKDESLALESGHAVRRPLLASGVPDQSMLERVNKLMDARRDVYDSAQLHVCTDWLDAEGVASLVLAELGMTTKRTVIPVPDSFRVHGAGVGRVVVGASIVGCLASVVEEQFPRSERVVLLTEPVVYGYWGETVRASLAESGRLVDVIEVPQGEEAKRLSELERVSNKMLSLGVARSDLVVGLGGGAIGDLAGLVASLYMRGVGLVHVASTLLAQVDAAIGGKTAINLAGGKNALGTFYSAATVISDVDLLRTLSERAFSEGLAEVVKYALIDSSDFFVWLENHTDDIIARENECLTKIVKHCSQVKIRFVARDVEDRAGTRALLNFGHTVGHAVENLAGYGQMLHGEAVAIGMIQAFRIGEQTCKLSPDWRKRTESLLSKFNLPTQIPAGLLCGVGIKERWQLALRADKKRISDVVNFILVKEPGEARQQEISFMKLMDSLRLSDA